jgi:peptidoglycan/xylan/chitin deacetylase (PgdA/CDA1 family)
MYHNVVHHWSDDLYTVQARLFAQHLQGLRLTDHHPVTLSHIADWLDGRGSLPARASLITFDDGYLDTLEVALPLLQRFRATACIFVTTSWCGSKQGPASTRGHPLLTWPQLRQLADAGVEVGAHTVTHPFLTEMAPERAWEEIHHAKHELEDRLGREVQAFSYPNSKHNPLIREMVQRAGYRLAFGGTSGLSRRETDRYNLYRPCIYNFCQVPEFLLSISTGVDVRTHCGNWRRQLRTLQYVPNRMHPRK